MIKISAVVCTYNRASLLPALLERLAGQSLPKDRYEVMVVDDGSTDDTRGVVGNFIAGHPNFFYFYESGNGLSRARNRGVREAKGEIVVFIDDDAVPEAGWLAEHLKVYEEDKTTAAAGGRIELVLPPDRSLGALAPYRDLFSMLDLGDATASMEWPRHPIGANFSVLKEAGDRVGWFSERLGRKGCNLFSNEEKAFFYEIMVREHLTVFYNPKAFVFHLVPPERLTRRFILKRTYAQGTSDAVFDRWFVGPDSFFCWAGKKVSGKKPRERMAAFASVRKERKDPFFHLCFKAVYFLGYFRGFFIRNR